MNIQNKTSVISDINLHMIDYSQVQLKFSGEIRHFIKNTAYYLYLLPELLILSRKPYENEPKYIMKIDLKTNIGWKVNSRVQELQINCLIFKYKQSFKEFYANNDQLHKFTYGKIADFYEPQFLLGKGSSARVIMIQALYNDKKKYAAKSIDKAYIEKNDCGLEAFITEVSIMKKVSMLQGKQNRFVNLYEVFEGDMTYYMVIDILEGKTLQEELEIMKLKKEKLSIQNVKIIMRELLMGVQQMHNEGIIHRDLKPDNIMFTELRNFKTLKIVDFGLATETKAQKYMFPKCGTPGYVAPEILNLIDRNYKYDPVCDIFSCGCILFKLLTGSSLFPGTQFNDVLKLNKACEIDLRMKLKDINHEAQEILSLMLEKLPENRPSAKQLLQMEFFQNESSIVHYYELNPNDMVESELIQQQIQPVYQLNPQRKQKSNKPKEEINLKQEKSRPKLRSPTLPQVNECFIQFEASINSIDDIDEIKGSKQTIQILPIRSVKPLFKTFFLNNLSPRVPTICQKKNFHECYEFHSQIKLSEQSQFTDKYDSFVMRDTSKGIYVSNVILYIQYEKDIIKQQLQVSTVLNADFLQIKQKLLQ